MGIVEQRAVSRLKGTVPGDYSSALFYKAVSRLFLISGISSLFRKQSIKKPFVNIGGRMLVERRVSELVS
jgi:hypothetical protein